MINLLPNKIKRKALFYASLKKASITIESAFVLPLFFLAIITVIYFAGLYPLQTKNLVEVCDKGKTAAMIAYNTNANDLYFSKSTSFSPLKVFLPLPNKKIYNYVRVRCWSGRATITKNLNNDKTKDEMVYITETGKVYHKSPYCSYINIKVWDENGNNLKSLRNREGRKYTSCEICARGKRPPRIYVTNQGTKYHSNPHCPGIKRTVRLVKKSQLKGYSPCSKCGG